MKQLGDLINDFLKQMDQDRVRNDQRMADLLKQLASQAPVAGSLPAEQKAFAEQLNKRQSELNKAPRAIRRGRRRRGCRVGLTAQVDGDGPRRGAGEGRRA